jgi:hypothetical protein
LALKLMQSSDDRFHPTTSSSGICRRKLVLMRQTAIPSGSARRTTRWCWNRFRYPGLDQDAPFSYSGCFARSRVGFGFLFDSFGGLNIPFGGNKAPKAPKKPAEPKTAGVREGSNAMVIALLQRPNGATLEEIRDKMAGRSTRSADLWPAGDEEGRHTVESFKSEKGERTYRINQ